MTWRPIRHLSQPYGPVVLLEDHWISVVKFGHHRIDLGRDDDERARRRAIGHLNPSHSPLKAIGLTILVRDCMLLAPSEADLNILGVATVLTLALIGRRA
jgi:hypothetical protein